MSDPLHTLYPEIEPYENGYLDVGDGHALYYEVCGNPDGFPVVFLHGGPGGSILPFQRQFFDPDVYRIILFDQRGCGKSKPFAALEHNTTPHLIRDMEKLRLHLHIVRWCLFGYSWGSTLAMAYTIEYPHTVKSLIMGGIFTGRPSEVRDYLLPGGVGATMFPDAYRDFLSPLTSDEQEQPFAAYIRIFHDPVPEDADRRDECIRQWFTWETVLMTMQYPLAEKTQASLEQDITSGIGSSIALLETHYIGQDCFIDANILLEKLNDLGSIPCFILQGRLDVVCPVQTAWDVHCNWPNSRLDIIPSGSHWTKQNVMIDAILRATNAMPVMMT